MFRKVSKEQLRVPAHIDYLAELREFVAALGRKHKLSESIIKAFKLAVDEAATNVIRHAYRESEGDGTITLRATVRKESVTLSIIDTGKTFDPRRVKDPDLTRYVEIGKRGGLGIMIMRRMMDDIEYRTTSEGNELRLTKKRETPAKGRIAKLVPGGFKAVTLGMKTRFWSKTVLFLALMIGGFYLYYFIMVPSDILREKIPTWNLIAGQIIKSLEGDKELLQDTFGLRQNNLLSSLISRRRDEIYEVALVDSLGRIQGHSNLDKFLAQYDFAPFGDAKRMGEHLYAYRVRPDSSAHPFPVLDYAQPVQVEESPFGDLMLHIRVYKARIDAMIAAERWRFARHALFFFCAAAAGAFVLIYLLMNPLRKLAEFVRSGGEVEIQEDLEIDTTSEVGAIAKAFTDITAKFRESQRHLAEQEKLQQEMQVAKEIQQTLLPHEFPDLEGYEIAGYYEAAALVGGDYYDFVEVDRDTLGIVVADVSGKGVPGSMIMTMIRQSLRTEARGRKDAAEVLVRLNDLVVGDMRKGMFVTIFYVIIDSKRRRLNFASAGHNPMILYRSSTNKTYYLNPRGFPIGIELPDKDLFRQTIESDIVQLVEGDLVLLYTDGITEAMDDRREQFGEERLLETIRKYGRASARPFAEKLGEAIQGFTRGHPQTDDITFVTLCEKTTQQKEELRRAKEAYKMIMAGTSIRAACETAGISTFAYYNKYKRTFEEEGVENYEIDEAVSLEARHIAIEDKAKILDIVRNHPEYGAKRISDELNSEKYGWLEIPENKIYEELVRSRLNTRALREAFVARSAGSRRRQMYKTPGTPLITLDGRVITDFDAEVLSKSGTPSPEAQKEVVAARPQSEGAESDRKAPMPETPPANGDRDAVRRALQEEEDSITAPGERPAPPPIDEPEDEADLSSPAEPAAEPPAETGPREGADQEGGRGFFAIDELLQEEITRTFSESTSTLETDDIQAFSESETEAETGLNVSSPAGGDDAGELKETDLFIAGIDELLNEDALETTTVSMDGGVDFQTEIDAVSDAAGADAGEAETVANDTPEPEQTTPTKTEPGTPTRKISSRSLLFREQRMTRGYRYYKAQQFAQAITEFEKVVAEFPGYKKALKILANAYFRAARYEDAIKVYRQVKAKDPDDVAAHENLGLAYLKLGCVKEALKAWQALIELAPYRHDIRGKIEALRAKIAESTEN